MKRFVATALVLLASLVAFAQQPNPDKPPPEEFNQKVEVKKADGTVAVFGTGWKKDPAAVKQFLNRLERNKKAGTFEKAAPRLLKKYGDDSKPVFFWHSEKKVLGAVQKSWNQKSVGSCVGFGYGRSTQYVMLNEIVAGQRERYPGTDVAPEVIYGGSRVEVGGGGIDGDGSIGAWAADWVKNWGVVVRGKYGNLDLTSYSESTCRQLGDRGIPDDVEAVAKLHPITEVALLTTAEGLWAALGAGKGVPVCSDQGFTTSRDADGYCRRSGVWMHCMSYAGRFVHPTRGKSVIVQNSWSDYLGSANRRFKYLDEAGAVKEEELPEGAFCVELSVAAQAVRQGDTFVLAGLAGWEAAPPPDPVPPVPPQPMPGPGKPIVVEVDGVKVEIDFANKKVKLPAGWTTNLDPAVPQKPAAEALKDELTAKGIDPETIAAILRLIAALLEAKKEPAPQPMAMGFHHTRPQPVVTYHPQRRPSQRVIDRLLGRR